MTRHRIFAAKCPARHRSWLDTAVGPKSTTVGIEALYAHGGVESIRRVDAVSEDLIPTQLKRLLRGDAQCSRIRATAGCARPFARRTQIVIAPGRERFLDPDADIVSPGSRRAPHHLEPDPKRKVPKADKVGMSGMISDPLWTDTDIDPA